MNRDSKLDHAIKETIEYLEINGGYEDGHEPDEEDAIEELLGECGQTRDGDCTLAGTEYCDWECPFS